MNVNNKRFFDLAVKVIAGRATNAEQAELDTALASQPELRAEFVRLNADARIAKDVLPLVNAMGTTAGDFSPETKERAAIVFNLARSNAYKHFLERFLEVAGRKLHIPWWGIHFGLYLATLTVFVLLIDVPKIYPRTGYFSFGGEQIGEFLFTTFMLFHIRKCRSIAILAAARVEDNDTRLTWLRRYLAPAYRGWIVRRNSHPRGKRTQCVFRAWLATACCLLLYWGGQFLYYRGDLLWIFHAPRYWEVHYYPFQQLIYLYPTIAKAAMMVAGVGYFWWLSGLMKIVRGECPSILNSKQKERLYFDCRRVALRASMFVSVATAFWSVSDTLAKGFTFWSYLYSVLLVLIYAAQVAVIRKPRSSPRHGEGTSENFFRELIEFGISWQFKGIRRFAPALTLFSLFFGIGPLNQLADIICKS